MVCWDWKNKVGEVVISTGKRSPHDPFDLMTLSIYEGANCMMVLLYEYQDPTGKDKYIFQGYFDNLDHFKRNFNSLKEEVVRWVFNKTTNDVKKVAQALIKYGFEVHYLPSK